MTKILLISIFSAYTLSFLLYLVPNRRARQAALGLFALAFGGNVVASVARGIDAGHLPFSNMYETMLTLPVFLFPLAFLSRRYWKTDGGWIDPLIAAAIIFPSAFSIGRSFTPAIKNLPPALQSPFFLPHVVSYLIAYSAIARGFLFALVALFSKDEDVKKRFDRAAFINTSIGFPMMTLGLLLGAYWAKFAWGDYWSWDPKEVWSLISWFVFLLYFHMRTEGWKGPKWSALMLGLGFLAVVVTLFVVNLTPVFGGLHAYA